MEGPTLLYLLELMPPGRFPFRRSRWELWSGPTLLASGWRTSERHAERALRTAAARVAHARLGLHPLRPEDAAATGSFSGGGPTRVECGGVSCLVLPRRDAGAAASIAA
jgi:hypothetical protein